jgi:hypothetical protein
LPRLRRKLGNRPPVGRKREASIGFVT